MKAAHAIFWRNSLCIESKKRVSPSFMSCLLIVSHPLSLCVGRVQCHGLGQGGSEQFLAGASGDGNLRGMPAGIAETINNTRCTVSFRCYAKGVEEDVGNVRWTLILF